jgi:hypothetical protein
MIQPDESLGCGLTIVPLQKGFCMSIAAGDVHHNVMTWAGLPRINRLILAQACRCNFG